MGDGGRHRSNPSAAVGITEQKLLSKGHWFLWQAQLPLLIEWAQLLGLCHRFGVSVSWCLKICAKAEKIQFCCPT